MYVSYTCVVCILTIVLYIRFVRSFRALVCCFYCLALFSVFFLSRVLSLVFLSLLSRCAFRVGLPSPLLGVCACFCLFRPLRCAIVFVGFAGFGRLRPAYLVAAGSSSSSNKNNNNSRCSTVTAVARGVDETCRGVVFGRREGLGPPPYLATNKPQKQLLLYPRFCGAWR